MAGGCAVTVPPPVVCDTAERGRAATTRGGGGGGGGGGDATMHRMAHALSLAEGEVNTLRHDNAVLCDRLEGAMAHLAEAEGRNRALVARQVRGGAGGGVGVGCKRV